MPFNNPIPESRSRTKQSGMFSGLVQAESLMQIAIILPSAVFIGWLGGAWLDSKLHQDWIALVGIILGSIAGLSAAIRMAMAAGAGPKNANPASTGTEKGNLDKEP
jgi:F0F1-type ATP synthase assembly protein I